MLKVKQPITPTFDPWECYRNIDQFGRHTLSNIEVTTTNLCNMRCSHCAVGYTLTTKDAEPLPIEMILRRLDDIPHLEAFSITGGEPMFDLKQVHSRVLPLLRYAHERGVYTQLNSNTTMPFAHYEPILPYLDVLHISHNWGTVEEFYETGFAMFDRKPSAAYAEKLFQQLIDNSRQIARAGVLVSAETMLNKRTAPHLTHIHRQIVDEMGCGRHEVHPMYAVDFASSLQSLSLEEIAECIHTLLDTRNPDVWMLFGTLPFYPCQPNEDFLKLYKRLQQEQNVTVRNDPDGRSRLNINLFSGDVIVTDFGDELPVGNVQTDSLTDCFDQWLARPLAKSLTCHCPSVRCVGPNVLVKDVYYPEVDFTKGTSRI
ncbi:MAG: radical SAM/CxCxxxxC motif protein YfkAB [Bacilli bacterium]